MGVEALGFRRVKPARRGRRDLIHGPGMFGHDWILKFIIEPASGVA